MPILQAPPEWRGTSVQVCGLWPFATGSGTPMVGVPLGHSLRNGSTVCCDPISWFTRARLLSDPSMFVLGQLGLGKSSLMRRIALGLAGYGVAPMVFGDLKPDYVDLIGAMGGQVIRLGPGRGALNVLDAGPAARAVEQLTGHAREALAGDIQARRAQMVSALVTIVRGTAPTDREETVLGAALDVLTERHPGPHPPVLGDLLQVIQDAPAPVRAAALDRGDETRYRDLTDGLQATLVGLQRGRLGGTLGQQTSVPMDPMRPAVFDASSIDDGDTSLQAAVLLACWSYGFGVVEAAHTLADAGLAPRRNHMVILDELWRVLRAGRGLVDRVDALTRLRRTRGIGSAMVTHSMRDLYALPDEEDRMKAAGLVERSGLVVTGGLPADEMPRLTSVVDLSRAEQALVTSWSTPPSWTQDDQSAPPPGRGNFLIKVGGMPGIPVHVDLTTAELGLNDTNRRWTT